MSRLPVVGGDANTWGTVLNEFLGVGHHASGALKTVGVASFGRTGTLAVTVGAGRYLFPFDATLTGVVMAVNTAPTGASIVCDVNKNGTTIFTDQEARPTIAAGEYKTLAAAVPGVTACVAGDYLTSDIDQVGSTNAGADLVVQVFYVLA